MDLEYDYLTAKIKILHETIWERHADENSINEWLSNFAEDGPGKPSERLHALHLLSQFMYFGSRQVREMLKAIYRDLYRYPIIEDFRRKNADTLNFPSIRDAFNDELKHTRFFGLGNPSESGTHLLYFFRQENELPKDLFLNGYEIFSRRSGQLKPAVRYPDVRRYVFLDDFCGTGTQAETYLGEITDDLKNLKPDAIVAYYCLFGTKTGMGYVREKSKVDLIDCIFELDDSFRCFGPGDRYFTPTYGNIYRDFSAAMCFEYGQQLKSQHPLGYKNSQFLIGFYYNTPDNTLPIIWCDHPGKKWTPIFKRYEKHYSWK